MSFEKKFRIPENLNIEEIIEENKAVFYGNGLKKDNLIFICDALIKARANHRKQINETGNNFAPLSSEYLQEVVYRYRKYLDFLLANDIILTDNQFIVGEKCFGYCYNYPYSGQRLKEVVVDNYILKKTMRRASEKYREKLRKSMWGYSYLTEWWESGKLEIDIKGAFEWIENYEKAKIATINNDDTIKDKILAIENVIDTSEDFKHLVLSISSEAPRYGFSGEGHRFYNPISNLKRELRSFLTYDGKPLVDIDIKNSQPFLATALFKSSFWESTVETGGQILTLEGVSKDIHKVVKESKQYKHIITLLKTSKSHDQQQSQFKKYIDLVVEMGFYEYILEHFEPIYPDRFNERNKVKKEVLRIFYVANKFTIFDFYKPCQTFKSHFPEVYELFRLIKEIQDNYLPIILQRIESFLVIDIICKCLSQNSAETPFFTIHDNIITTKGNEGIVREIMSAEIYKWIGYEPKLDCNDLVPLGMPQIIETWKTISDFEGYEVSSIGNVRGIERKVKHSTWEITVMPKLLKTRVNNRGYKDVRLSKDGKTFTKLVHILTAEAFVPNVEVKPNVNHMDGNKLNNHFKNLSWVTHSENIQHAYDTGLIKKMKSKIVVDTCTGELYPSIKEAAKAIHISYGTCRNYLNGNIKNNKTCLKLAS